MIGESGRHRRRLSEIALEPHHPQTRFLLALKVVLSDRGSAPTLVFDEIDTGVGGAVADAIGARLARLAGQVQVIVRLVQQTVRRVRPHPRRALRR